MPDDNPHLRNVMRLAAAAEDSQPDEEAGLPSLDEKHYVAHARPANKPLYAIHFINPTGEVRTFQYVHLDSGSSFTAECITLIFLGLTPTTIVLAGRNLWKLYDYVHQHRMSWVMEAARDIAADGQVIVSKIVLCATKDE